MKGPLHGAATPATTGIGVSRPTPSLCPVAAASAPHHPQLLAEGRGRAHPRKECAKRVGACPPSHQQTTGGGGSSVGGEAKKIKRNQNERTPQRTCHTAAAWVCRMPRPHPEGRVHFRCQGSAAATGGGEAKEAHRIDPAGVHRHCQGGGRSRGPRLPQPTSGRYSPRVGRRRGLPAARAAPTHCLPAGQTPADLASPW